MVINFQTGKRESALRNGFRIDKMRVSKDEQEFLFSLHKFMKKRNTPIGRIPSLGFKQSMSSLKLCHFLLSRVK